jgi:rubrerythrin
MRICQCVSLFTIATLILGNYPRSLLLEPRIKQLEKNQKLYNLLKAQYHAEREELVRYIDLLGKVQNSIIRSYFRTLLSDGLNHVEYISQMMSDIEGASQSAGLTTEGIKKSISEEMESRELLHECLEMTDQLETRSIITSIIVDEDHHIKILEHMDQLVQSYSK